MTSGREDILRVGWSGFFSYPSRVAALLWLTGAVTVASVLLVGHRSVDHRTALVTIVFVAATAGALRMTIGWRFPPWSLEIDVALANLLVSASIVASENHHLELANLYLLSAFFAILYLPLGAALVQMGASATAYAVILGFGPSPATSPLVAWLAVFGVGAVLGAVVLVLVGALRAAARADPLTGLANRRMWDERLEVEMEAAARSGEALSVAMIDLDGFKAVNDRSGHDAGDQLLQNLARAWRPPVKGAGGFLARIGGDEFSLVVPGHDEAGIRGLAAHLEEALPHGISASIGVARWDGAENGSDLLRRADRVMYQTKRGRRAGEGSIDQVTQVTQVTQFDMIDQLDQVTQAEQVTQGEQAERRRMPEPLW